MEKAPVEPLSRAMPASPGDSLTERVATPERASPWDPRQWTRRDRIAVIAIILIHAAVLAIILGTTLGQRLSKYPDYYRIQYALQDAYAGNGFFDSFNYFSGHDPTHGFVHYIDEEGSMSQNLTQFSNTMQGSALATNTTAIIRVDTNDKNATTGRRSVRIESKKTYSSGLFIFDVVHSPYGCATWPALWISDLETWPKGGEIDVMEAVELGDGGNQMTLHTSGGCKIGKYRRRKQTGRALSFDCHNTTNHNQGCGVLGPKDSYGEAFNAKGGGVYAVEVRSEGIRVWMFRRDKIPGDILNQTPDPSMWGNALADFPNLDCNIEKHFYGMRIIANIDLCGDWAGQPNVFSAVPMCRPGTCAEWVTTNGSSFDQAYWEFGGFWVYERA